MTIQTVSRLASAVLGGITVLMGLLGKVPKETERKLWVTAWTLAMIGGV